MPDERLNIITPVGRIVAGHPATENTTGYQNQPLRDKQGNPKSEFYFALAVDKANPEWPTFWAQITAKAQQDFPGGHWQQPYFKWKVTDGDDPKYQGREGYTGHFIINMKSGYAPNLCNEQYQILQGNQIKRGDYVAVQVSVQGNGDTGQNCGMYINPNVVMFLRYGEEIRSGPNPQEVFANHQFNYIPAAASQTPVASAPMPGAPSPSAPQAPAPPPQPAMPQYPAGAGVPPVATMPPGTPAHGAAVPPMPQGGQPMTQTTAPPGAPAVAPPSNVQPAYDLLQPQQHTQPLAAAPGAPMPAQAPPAAAPGIVMPGVPQQPQQPGVAGTPLVQGDYIPH